MFDGSSIDWNPQPPRSRLSALLRPCWTYERKQLVSTPWFQSILVLLLTLGKLRTPCGCERQQVEVYLEGFYPSAFLTLCNSVSKGFWSQLCWLCVTEETQMISAPFCGSPGKGKEWNLGRSSLTQMPWGNLQSYRIKKCSDSICWVKQSESGHLYLQKHFL